MANNSGGIQQHDDHDVGLSIDDSNHDNANNNYSSNNNGGVDGVAASSSSALATAAAKRELERKVDELRGELRVATESLERFEERTTKGAGGSAKNIAKKKNKKKKKKKSFLPDGVDGGDAEAISMSESTRELVRAAQQQAPHMPPGKKGYLFKWMDRSIGWGGTKWALRFVTLEGGRISYYGSHNDAATSSPRYVLSLKGCAVREDGWKRNRRHHSPSTKKGEDPPLDETGAYFFLFSIYQRKSTSDAEDSDVVPLLRFSTPSMAEKNQWVQLISEACAYCETDEFQSYEASRAQELILQQREAAKMALAMPEAKSGTLPPLYFAPAFKPVQRRPSSNRMPDAKQFLTKSKNTDAEKVESRSTSGYPPSKPMHRCAAPSYLSVEAPAQNYRGLFNLGIIILVVSNFRLMLATVRQHGFVLSNVVTHLAALREIRRDPWEEFPFVSGFLLQLLFVTIGFSLEWLMSRRKLNSTVGMILHLINAHCALVIPTVIVWVMDKPVTGAILLLHASITWMKLVSYAHANEDYRILATSKAEIDAYKASLALVSDLDTHDMEITYPDNVTVGNMLYFWVAPTLTYQIAFPKYPRVRWLKISGILLRMLVVLTLFTFLVAQVVSPNLDNLVTDLEATNGTITLSIMAEYWLRLAITNTYLWLLMFYFYFHLYLNFTAELLRFGDRVFYKDWWNSSEVSDPFPFRACDVSCICDYLLFYHVAVLFHNNYR